MKKPVITCLGCKVNQAESAWLQECLAPERVADTAILLTCAVTANASRQSRQMARRLLKSHGRVIVSGCDSQLNAPAYYEMGACVLPRAHLASLEQEDSWPLWKPGQAMPAPQQGAWVTGRRAPGTAHTRAQLKVQDGCDANCAYCIVPFSRGLPRSLPLQQAARAFADLGHSGEVVLSGIHLGRYNDGQHTLTDLLRALLTAHQGPRIRLSSLEAMELSDELLNLLASNPRLCPHLHLPLQSGSDKVLAAMGRTYTAAQYAGQVRRAVSAIPGLCLGADVLVGLPGEDETAFAQTLSLLSALPVSYLHVFPYSPRPGTKAALMGNLPDSASVQQRAASLRRLGREKWLAYLQSQVGKTLVVLSEKQHMGRAANYCLVNLPQGVEAGKMLSVRINQVVGQEPLRLAGNVV